MSGTYKDKHKTEKPVILKNEHKAHRQFARKVINYVPVQDEDENVEAFKPTEEEVKDYQDYLESKDKPFIQD